MKKFIFYAILFFAFANSLQAQSPCSAQYTFTVAGDSTTCVYVFTPSVPVSPAICSIKWTISSIGPDGVSCDPEEITGGTLTYHFCFNGYYSVKMCVYFCDGTSCCVTQTVFIRCVGADECDPDPDRVDDITNPRVEITYISPDTCHFNRSQPVAGCMYSPITGSGYYISCGWKWAIRVPPSNCSFWNFCVRYDSITSCGQYTCVTRCFDTTIICIRAYIDRPIYVYAIADDCCLPDGYLRGYYWTPTPSTGSPYTPISDPANTISTLCSAYRRCPDYTYCIENTQIMTETTGPAACFSGGGQTEQRFDLKTKVDIGKEQQVTIYNIQGIEVFRGKWKFGSYRNDNLNWPGNINTGVYLVRFENSTELLKLYKFN